MKNPVEMFEKITKLCDESDATLSLRAVSRTLAFTLNKLEDESKSFLRLRANEPESFAGAEIEFICSFLGSLYVNATSKTFEEAKEKAKEFNADQIVKVGEDKKADA